MNYVVEGSGQKYGNSYRLRVQIISANNKRHLWAESYEKEIKETKDIYETQSQIAQSIAEELKATITPEEKQLIDETSTTNLTALDFSQQGRDEQIKYWLNFDNTKALKNAISYYKLAWFQLRWVIVFMENDPFFQNIRSTERFQEILNTSKSNWQKEHEKVCIWLKENNMLKI